MALWYHKTDSFRWLTGSIRQDLVPDERSVWADFMAMAALTREPRRGYIERSEGIPYDKPYLLNFLNITEELFDRTVGKCVKEGRLQVFEDGTMLLTNFNRYNDVTDYEAKRSARQASIERSMETKRRNENATLSLIRAINEMNARLKIIRYTPTEDGYVLDTKTGEKLSVIEAAKRDEAEL